MAFSSKYFKLAEFQCHCGKCPPSEPSPDLVTRLDQVREAVGEPVVLSSAIRCKDYNDKVGGVGDSAHVLGQAADISVPDSTYRYKLLHPVVHRFQRYGIGKTFVHVDVSTTLDQHVAWTYYS